MCDTCFYNFCGLLYSCLYLVDIIIYGGHEGFTKKTQQAITKLYHLPNGSEMKKSCSIIYVKYLC